MKLLLAMLPTLVLVVFSQVGTKWRIQALQAHLDDPATSRLWLYLTDWWIWSAYGAAFLGGVFWMFVVERYDISLAFPIYIGLTVLCVALAGALLFGEQIGLTRVAAIALILSGVALAVRS